MNEKDEKINAKVHEIGQMLGLSKKETDNILVNILPRDGRNSFSLGPGGYGGGYYGTVSINDFKIQTKSN